MERYSQPIAPADRRQPAKPPTKTTAKPNKSGYTSIVERRIKSNRSLRDRAFIDSETTVTVPDVHIEETFDKRPEDMTIEELRVRLEYEEARADGSPTPRELATIRASIRGVNDRRAVGLYVKLLSHRQCGIWHTMLVYEITIGTSGEAAPDEVLAAMRPVLDPQLSALKDFRPDGRQGDLLVYRFAVATRGALVPSETLWALRKYFGDDAQTSTDANSPDGETPLYSRFTRQK